MKKVILVHSVKSFYEENGSLLNRSDFQIFTAATGMEALEIHRRERVSLIVADLDMPDIAGDRMCSMLRSDADFKKVSVLLTCRNDPGEIERVRKGGANGWVTLPIQSDRLVTLIGQFLNVSMRQGYRVLLKITVHGTKESTSFLCTSKNISATGILIETDKVLAEGDRITCSFFLPTSGQIITDGETVRSEPGEAGLFQYGIRFIGLAPSFRTAIETFVGSRA